jgi:AcrR family transcriptional regulator
MILDAAATVIRSKGIARATTKEIAREAGCSEALLYKHFVDKQGIYLAALKERLLPPGDDVEPGSGDVHDNLVDIVVDLMASYVATFPMSASIFSDRDLLAAWRAGMAERGAGPRGPVRMIERYLDGELTLGRVAPQTDSAAIAALLCGAAFQAAFLACYDGLPEVSDGPALAERLVSASFGA